MKRTLLISICVAAAASIAYADFPPFGVAVVDASGKVTYRGRTTPAGTFTTPVLPSGDYTVQLNSNALPPDSYAVFVSAGKQKVVAEALPSEKFAKGGIAMKVKVRDGVHITGQVSTGKAGDGVAMNSGATRIKIINGKRWFLVKGSTGSQLGEHWVEEGMPEARNMGSYNKDAIQRLQEKAKGAPNEGGPPPIGGR